VGSNVRQAVKRPKAEEPFLKGFGESIFLQP